MPTRQFDQMVEIFTKRGSALLEIRARAYRARAAASREDALEQLAQIEDLANQAFQNPEALRLELDELLPAPGACPACGQQHEGRCMESLG